MSGGKCSGLSSNWFWRAGSVVCCFYCLEMSLNGSFLEKLPTLSKQEEDIFGYNFMYCLESMIQEIGTLLVGKLSTHSNGTSIRGWYLHACSMQLNLIGVLPSLAKHMPYRVLFSSRHYMWNAKLTLLSLVYGFGNFWVL